MWWLDGHWFKLKQPEIQLSGTVCYHFPVAQHTDINSDNGNGSNSERKTLEISLQPSGQIYMLHIISVW